MKNQLNLIDRKIYLDIIKIFACFFVLINHTSGLILQFNSNNIFNNIFYIFETSFSKMGVPLFIMISGSLILKKNYTFKDVFEKIFRILVPLILISLLFHIKKYGFSFGFVKSFLENPIQVYLWYLYMLIGLYLITPIVQQMVTNFNSNHYFYLIVIGFILPQAISLIGLVFEIKISNFFTTAFFPAIVIYYMIGLFLSKINKTKKKRNIALIVFISSQLLFFLCWLLPYLKTSSISLMFDSFSNLFVGLSSMSIFYLIRYYFEDMKTKNSNIISVISATTFGIYLIHTIVGHEIYEFTLTETIFGFNAILGVILLQIVTFVLCSLVIYILRKFPLARKFL